MTASPDHTAPDHIAPDHIASDGISLASASEPGLGPLVWAYTNEGADGQRAGTIRPLRARLIAWGLLGPAIGAPLGAVVGGVVGETLSAFGVLTAIEPRTLSLATALFGWALTAAILMRNFYAFARAWRLAVGVHGFEHTAFVDDRSESVRVWFRDVASGVVEERTRMVRGALRREVRLTLFGARGRTVFDHSAWYRPLTATETDPDAEALRQLASALRERGIELRDPATDPIARAMPRASQPALG
ncbi:MAG: hypothetical protein AB7S26_27640 [Sandaracinaceae bacterium]